MEPIQVFEIWDSEYETTYTAHIQKNGSGWIGWIQEYPKVKCEGSTQKALLETLENTLYETLEADWEAWDKQIEEDIKAGRLDRLRKEALEDLGVKTYPKKSNDKPTSVFNCFSKTRNTPP